MISNPYASIKKGLPMLPLKKAFQNKKNTLEGTKSKASDIRFSVAEVPQQIWLTTNWQVNHVLLVLTKKEQMQTSPDEIAF